MKISRRSFLMVALGALAAGVGLLTRRQGRAASKSDVIVEDVFGNAINDKGIALVDWDGYIANPAVQIFLRPPADLVLPATVILTTSDPLLYFDLPSDVGATGPQRKVDFQTASDRVPVYLSTFPDRDTNDRDITLNLSVIDINGNQRSSTLNVHVFDQDTNEPSAFHILVDFSQDKTGFFQNSQACDAVRQAAQDWSYFIGDMHLDSVPAGSEKKWIWDPDSFSSGAPVTNAADYTGFLLYVYGHDIPEHRSGGEGSHEGGFQSSHGNQLPLRRSGGVAVETKGNYNVLGWSFTTEDRDWWKAANTGDQVNELFSIVHHEMGHALFFNNAYPNFVTAKSAGSLSSDDLLAYHGHPLKIDSVDHFAGELDDASGFGAFGNEYYGAMPHRRWIITKVDILAAEAVGYRVRKTFDLAVLTASLPNAEPAKPYSATLKARGGIPWYTWALEDGQLPPGLSLDAEKGTISGTPSKDGAYHFSIGVTDSSQSRTHVTAPLTITIGQAHPPAPTKHLPSKSNAQHNSG